MKVIGDRVSILKKEDLLSIVILPKTDKRKIGLMFLWLFAWTVCGFIIIANYFKITDQNSKVFMIIYLSFWAYFEFKIARAFVWRKYGKEKLWISDGKIHYKQEIRNRGKIKEYDLSLVQDLVLIDFDENSFSAVISNSFWMKGGETITFSCMHKNVRFGLQLEQREAKAIIHEINHFLFT